MATSLALLRRIAVVMLFATIAVTTMGIGRLQLNSHYTGTLALNEAYIEVVQHDLTRIVPLLLLVMMVVLGWLLRSRRAVLTMMPVGSALLSRHTEVFIRIQPHYKRGRTQGSHAEGTAYRVAN